MPKAEFYSILKIFREMSSSIFSRQIAIISAFLLLALYLLTSKPAHSDVFEVTSKPVVKSEISNAKFAFNCLKNGMQQVEKTSSYSHPPQLSKTQLFWITFSLCNRFTNRGKSNLLVFGEGYDSKFWISINPSGRTVFLEDNDDWMNMISKEIEGIEAYKISYDTKVSEAEFFFKNPREPHVHENARKLCYDTILVDAPMGFKEENPGRFQSALFAINHARKCINSFENEAVTIFVHDVNRPGEKEILNRMFFNQNDIKFLGYEGGPAGKLAGFLVIRSNKE